MLAGYIPKSGDVGIFEVANPMGGYIMDENGRPDYLFEGDLLMLAFGHRYATNQVEGYVPVQPVTRCQLLGRGGVAGIVRSKNALFKNMPAELELVGYATDERGNVLNTIRENQLFAFTGEIPDTRVILSVGSSMDSGKTTSAAWLCGGLKQAGYRVAYLKLTGTTFPKDAELALARGADYANDFSHFGFPSTYLLHHHTLLNLYQSLLDEAIRAVAPDYVVIEIADGLFQRETSMLLHDHRFILTVDNIMLSCGDSLSALTGIEWLKKTAFAPFALSGLFTASPLLISEVQSYATVPVLALPDLLHHSTVELLQQTRNRREKKLHRVLQKAA